jgi:hypothetical protein
MSGRAPGTMVAVLMKIFPLPGPDPLKTGVVSPATRSRQIST